MVKRVALFVLFLFAAGAASAQIVPYYGKNNVKYDTFDWKTYKTEHFEIYFYPEEQEHLQRVASMAESSYDVLSDRMQHEVDFNIPLIFFKTQSEFEQVNYLQIYEGILGAAEPAYNRMAFAIDQPSDLLNQLITHELGHIFEFSMLYGGILTPVVKQAPPGWVMEGFADYLTGVWDPTDLMVVRDAVLTERVPFLSIRGDLLAPGGTQLGRAPYNIGHAAFDFIEEKYGDAAIRQFWFYLKKATLLGTEDVIFSALGVKEEAFNEQYAQYLRQRFSAWKDKQSPVDYGKEVSLPKKYFQIFSQMPSPDGKRIAVFTASREDFEFDILIMDRQGKILENLTGGLTTTYDYLTTDSFTFEGRNISWSRDGSKIAFFARTGKRRSLFIFDARDGSREKKIKMDLDQAASPSISPDGRMILFTAFRAGHPDLFSVNLQTEEIKNLTNNMLLEKTPVWSPDGKTIYFTSRINSRDQIIRMDASNPNKVEQLTFADYNSTSPIFDPSTNSLFYAADKGGVFNIYKLDLNTGDKIQYTDVIGANFSPVILHEDGKDKVFFTSFFKGEYRFFIMDLPKPVTLIAKGTESSGGEVMGQTDAQALAKGPGEGTSVAQTDSREFPQEGPLLSDFHPTKKLVIDQREIKDKKFRLLISGRPNVITGVSGNTFAVASGIVLQDILGDQEFRFFTSRIRGFQSYNVGYLDLGHRLQFLTDFNFNDDFFFINGFGLVRNRIYGGQFLSQYPINRYYRLEMGAGIFDLSQRFYEELDQRQYEEFLQQTGREDILNNGGYLPLSVAFVAETTRFREFGPLAGHTLRLSYSYAAPVKDTWISRSIYEADLRKYFRVTNRSLFAVRGRGFYSQGRDPVFSLLEAGRISAVLISVRLSVIEVESAI